MSSYQNKILLRGISKSFDNMVILKDINIEVNEGELVSIVGPSGSGKSTIFNICLLYTSPSPRDAHESRMPSSA